MKLRVFASLITLLAAGLGAALWQERAARAELAAQATRLSRQLADLRYEAKQAARQAESIRSYYLLARVRYTLAQAMARPVPSTRCGLQ